MDFIVKRRANKVKLAYILLKQIREQILDVNDTTSR